MRVLNGMDGVAERVEVEEDMVDRFKGKEQGSCHLPDRL